MGFDVKSETQTKNKQTKLSVHTKNKIRIMGKSGFAYTDYDL